MPGFKDFTSAVLSSADVDGYLMQQAVIQCTSSTRPSSPHEGMTVYETDTNRYMGYSGSVWTPISQSSSNTFTMTSTALSVTTNYGYWTWSSGWVTVIGKGSFASAGLAGVERDFILNGGTPPPPPNFTVDCCGSFTSYVQSTGVVYCGSVYIEDSFGIARCRFFVNGHLGGIGAAPSVATSIGDNTAFMIRYPTIY